MHAHTHVHTLTKMLTRAHMHKHIHAWKHPHRQTETDTHLIHLIAQLLNSLQTQTLLKHEQTLISPAPTTDSFIHKTQGYVS